jgi:hypothetical protein
MTAWSIYGSTDNILMYPGPWLWSLRANQTKPGVVATEGKAVRQVPLSHREIRPL